jgi:hypothetical protein
MKFILKDKHIFVVENQDLVYNIIEGDVILDEAFSSSDVKLQFSVNGGLYREIEGGKISVSKDEIKEAYFELTIRALFKDFSEVFKSDKIPLTHAIILGHSMEYSYPEIIRSLIQATSRLEAQQKDIIKVLNYLDTKGDVL